MIPRDADALRVMVAGMLIALALLSAAYLVDAQPSRESALDQYARDVKDHRDWIESQLATAKVTITDLQRQLQACNVSPTRAFPGAQP